MKPRSSVISVIASLIILFACFTQIGVTAYIGNVNPTLDKSSRYESSYVVERFNSTHYQATNGTSGAVEFLSNNATYVVNTALSHLTSGRWWKETVVLKGIFVINNTILVGGYTVLDLNSAVITRANNMNANAINVTSGAQWTDIIGGTLQGNKGNNVAGSGIVLGPNVKYCKLLKNWISYFDTYGIRLYGSSGSTLTLDNRVETNWIDHCDTAGIYFDSYSSDNICMDNDVYMCPLGIRATGGTKVWHNHVFDSNGSPNIGIKVEGSDVSVQSNIVEGIITEAIKVTPASSNISNVQVIANTIKTSNTNTVCHWAIRLAGWGSLFCVDTQVIDNKLTLLAAGQSIGHALDFINTVRSQVSDNDFRCATTVFDNLPSSSDVFKDNKGYNTGLGADVSTASYIVYASGSNYYAVNGSSGLVEFGPTTNASYIFQSIVKTNTTVFVKVGNYYINKLIPIGVSRFSVFGENWGTQFSIGTTAGFNISSASLLSDISFRNILWHSVGGNANYMITSRMPTNTRISAFTFDNNRVQYFEKAGTIALDLCNLEVSFITNNFWYRTRTAHIRLWAYRYDMGNIRITGNVFYSGYNQDYENAIRLYTSDSYGGNGAIGSIFSSNNQFFGEAYGSTAIAWNLTTYADRINWVSSTSDRYENTRMFKTTCYNSTSIISRIYISDCQIWGEDAQIFIDFGAYTRISVVKNNAFELYNAAGTFVKDLSESTTEYNRYENNQFRGTANFTSSYVHYWSGNFGTGFLELLYTTKTSGTDLIRMNGLTLCLFAPVYNNIGNNTVWTVGTNDVYISTSGGTIINITVYNLNSQAVGVFTAHVTALRIPFHWKFSISYAVLPTLKLTWVN